PQTYGLLLKKKLSIQQTLLDSGVCVHPPVPQKRPVRPKFVHPGPVDFANYDFLPIDRTFGDDLAVRAANEALPPKFASIAARRRFVANAICRRNIATVRNRVTTLNRFPRTVLCLSEFLLLARMPTDRRRIKNNFGSAQGGQPSRFRIPLVPANTNTDFAVFCFPRQKSKIARRKVKLLVVERIVRNVHFAVFAKKFSVRVNDCGGVVINTGPAFFEEGCDNRDPELSGQLRQVSGRFSGNFLRQRKVLVVFGL